MPSLVQLLVVLLAGIAGLAAVIPLAGRVMEVEEEMA